MNFVYVDSRGRTWLTISTRTESRRKAAFEEIPDGYIVLIDGKDVRVVADGLCFPNELRLDENVGRLYVAETAARRLSVFDVADNGALSGFCRHGPGTEGRPDGIALDAEGSVWLTDFDNRRILVYGRDGACIEFFRDPTGETLANPTSLTFAGDDLRTVHVGSLTLEWLPTFRAPVTGAPMSHWKRAQAPFSP